MFVEQRVAFLTCLLVSWENNDLLLLLNIR